MVYPSIINVNMSILQKRWVQDLIVYSILTILALFIIFGIANGIKVASAPVTEGNVHWHAKISYKVCGEEVALRDQTTEHDSLIHGHNDELVHVEGTVLSNADITLAKYFEHEGHDISSDHFQDYKNGDLCPGSETPGKLKFIVNGTEFSDPNEIVIADDQKIEVVFE